MGLNRALQKAEKQMSKYTLWGRAARSRRPWPRQAVGPQCFALVALQPRLGVSQQHSLGGAGEPSFQGLLIANLAEHLCLAVVLWTRIGKEMVLILFLHVSAGV